MFGVVRNDKSYGGCSVSDGRNQL